MTGLTRLQRLENSGPNDLDSTLQALQDPDGRGFGTIIQGLGVPVVQVFTGLVSNATQTAPHPGWVFGVATGGVNKTLIYAGAAGAGEALVVYTEGVPAITFGDGVVTAYDLHQAAMPDGLAAILAAAP